MSYWERFDKGEQILVVAATSAYFCNCVSQSIRSEVESPRVRVQGEAARVQGRSETAVVLRSALVDVVKTLQEYTRPAAGAKASGRMPLGIY